MALSYPMITVTSEMPPKGPASGSSQGSIRNISRVGLLGLFLLYIIDLLVRDGAQ